MKKIILIILLASSCYSQTFEERFEAKLYSGLTFDSTTIWIETDTFKYTIVEKTIIIKRNKSDCYGMNIRDLYSCIEIERHLFNNEIKKLGGDKYSPPILTNGYFVLMRRD